MTPRPVSRRFRFRQRRGAMLLLVVFALVILLAAAAFSVDVAYMQLIRTQLRIATDAAARSGAEALHRTQDRELARAAAKRIAGEHRIGGKPLTLRDEDIVLGRSSRDMNGQWRFVSDEEPLNSVQVLGDRTDRSAGGSVSLLFGSLLGRSRFEPSMRSVVAKVGAPKRDLCLVVDRSHSMAFDLSETDWTYPADAIFETNPQTGELAFSAWRTSPRSRNDRGGLGDARRSDGRSLGSGFLYNNCPIHPSLSRWAALADAGAVFLDALRDTEDKERVGLASYSTSSSIDIRMTEDYPVIQTALDDRRARPMPGSTNIAAGIRDGIRVLTERGATREGAKRVLVLMTDGVWNQGGTPIPAAHEAAVKDITIMTITFSDGANQADMRTVAQVGGGSHYHAPTAEELRRIFKQIAEGMDELVFVE